MSAGDQDAVVPWWTRVLPVRPAGERPRALGAGRLLVLNAYWFALSYLWQPLGIFLLPILVGRTFHPVPLRAGDVHLLVDKNVFLALVSGAGLLVAIVWQPAAGAMSDRSRIRIGRRRPFIAAGAAGTIVALALLATSGSAWRLLGAYVLLQVFSNTAQGPYQGMLPDQVPPSQRGQASAYYAALQLIAILAGSILIGVVLVPAGATGPALFSMAVLVAAGAAAVLAGVPDVVSTGRPASRGRLLLSFAFDARSHPDFAWLLASRLFFFMALAGTQQYLLYFIQATFHVSDRRASALAGYMLVASLGTSVGASFLAGHVSERIGRKPVIAAACAAGGACCLLLVAVHSTGALVALGVLLGVASGAFLSVDWAFATDLIPQAEAGRYMGISNLVTAGSGILAGLLLGPLIDAVNGGRQSSSGYQVMFVVAAGFFFAALALLARVREVRPSWRPA